jgi:hypothetical protein
MSPPLLIFGFHNNHKNNERRRKMDSKSETIIEKQMSISEIEKKWDCNTDRAVKLFCKALGIRKPNTDKLDAWSKHKLKKYSSYPKEDIKTCSNSQSGCSSCHSCHGTCDC